MTLSLVIDGLAIVEIGERPDANDQTALRARLRYGSDPKKWQQALEDQTSERLVIATLLKTPPTLRPDPATLLAQWDAAKASDLSHDDRAAVATLTPKMVAAARHVLAFDDPTDRPSPVSNSRYEIRPGPALAASIWRAVDNNTMQEITLCALAEGADEIALQVLAVLRHPHLARVGWVAAAAPGRKDLRPVLPTEWLDGGTLAVWSAGGRPAVEATQLLAGIADALAELHAYGLAHGRLKATTIRFDYDGVAKLAGLHTATRLREVDPLNDGPTLTGCSSLKTVPTASVVGGRQIEEDLNALGGLLFRAVTGTEFADEYPPEMPPVLQAIHARCTARSRGLRYPTAAAVADDLRAFAANPQLIPGATLVEYLSSGGYGEVFRADIPKFGGEVVVKVFYAGSPLERAESESAIFEQLHEKDSNIPAWHYTGTTDAGRPYLIREFARGKLMREWLNDRPDLPDAIRCLASVAAAVATMHSEKVVHRDLKPENILLVMTGSEPRTYKPRIIDFGLATFASHPASCGPVWGTVGYMAPEVTDGKKIDSGCDVFALGVMLVESIVHHSPFTGLDKEQVIEQTKKHKVDLSDWPNDLLEWLDRPLRRLVIHCLDPEPGKRPTAYNMASQLLQLSGFAIPKKSPPTLSAGDSRNEF